MTQRHLFVLIGLLALLGGCSATPNYDALYGDAVRQARVDMTLDPQAGERERHTPGLDGKSAEEAIKVYQGTFKEPPPVVNVINIGGPSGRGK